MGPSANTFAGRGTRMRGSSKAPSSNVTGNCFLGANFKPVGPRDRRMGGPSSCSAPLTVLPLCASAWKVPCRRTRCRASCQLRLRLQVLYLLSQCRSPPGMGPNLSKLVNCPKGSPGSNLGCNSKLCWNRQG